MLARISSAASPVPIDGVSTPLASETLAIWRPASSNTRAFNSASGLVAAALTAAASGPAS
ncbi:hypothetical protein D3C73_1010320 [compost metagenome]